MVKMMITVVIIYALCWLPLHVIQLVGDWNGDIWYYQYIQLVWIACNWLAMSNCCYNPMVYCWMNSKFRNGFRYVLRYCPCVTFDTDEHGPVYKAQRVHTYVTTMRPSSFTRETSTGICKCSGGVMSSGRSSTRFRNTDYTPYCRRQINSETIPLHKVKNGTTTKTNGNSNVITRDNRCYVSGIGGGERQSVTPPKTDNSYRTSDIAATEAEKEPLTLDSNDWKKLVMENGSE